jgi:hypothetical protein
MSVKPLYLCAGDAAANPKVSRKRAFRLFTGTLTQADAAAPPYRNPGSFPPIS